MKMLSEDWKYSSKESPPYHTPVLGWFECDKCFKKIPHAHNTLARITPLNGPWIVTFNKADSTAKAHYIRVGRPVPNWAEKDHWHPEQPKYWRFINSPYQHPKDSENAV